MKASAVVNLTFHGIGKPPPGRMEEESVWVSEPQFRQLLVPLAREPRVRITFDDGNASDVEVALPCLAEHGLSATFFIVVDRIGTQGFLSGDDVRRLVDAGMRIGVHGLSHRSWRGQPPDLLRRELTQAKDELESIAGVEIPTAACPFGAYDRHVLRTVRAIGFQHVFTSDRGWTRGDAWLQPRESISPATTTADVARILKSPRLPATVVGSARSAAKRWRQ
jgi:peptidoglycan/xylan/chitin deacetylase (PgdA/CDA1 family)